MTTYEDVPVELRARLSNGCGSKGGPFRWCKPPSLCFGDACCRHDVEYAIGGTKADKSAVDLRFWKSCRDAAHLNAQANDHGTVRETATLCAAWMFYIAVREGGRFSFAYGPQRTLAELEALAGF